MPPIPLHFPIAIGTALMLLSSGCTGDSNGGRKPALANVEEAKEYTGPKPKKENLPDLPSGAGKMDEDAPDELAQTRSGLYYRVLRKSNGRRPGPADTVLAHYRGTLDDGTQFDSSYGDAEPKQFVLNQVVPAWTEGLQLVGEGGMIELEVPPKLGYGVQGHPPVIPPNARLHFIIELVEVKRRP